MFGFRISPLKAAKPKSLYAGCSLSDKSNPFDSDDELDHMQSKSPSRRRTPEPLLATPDIKTNPFDEDHELDHTQAKNHSGRRTPEPLLATPGIKTNPFDEDHELDHTQAKNHSGRRTPEPLLATPGIKTNPFDDDCDENRINSKNVVYPLRRTSPESLLSTPDIMTNPFDDEDDRREKFSCSLSSSAKSKYNNDFRDSGGLENQPVQDLENYAEHKAKETTKSVRNCLKIAEEIRENATKTLVTLHQQGEQITRTHYNAVDIDHDLSRGEKLLGSLGGFFSKTWKPKKAHSIKGPVVTRDVWATRSSNMEQRENLGLTVAPKGLSRENALPPPTSALQKVEVEKAKQDDALCDLSNLLGELKNMAVDMGSEIDRHSKDLDHLYDDVDELHSRVKGANQRGRRLLGK